MKKVLALVVAAAENYGAKRVTFSTAFSGGYYGGPLSL